MEVEARITKRLIDAHSNGQSSGKQHCRAVRAEGPGVEAGPSPDGETISKGTSWWTVGKTANRGTAHKSSLP